jgi:hypothetical protein
VAVVTDDWDDDSDTTRVHYDLAAWTFDQQAELAGALANAAINHSWDVTELVIAEADEEATDAIIAEIEERLGIVDGHPAGAPIPLADDEPSTEYELADWPEADRSAIARSLLDAEFAHRWEGDVLVVASADEDVVDELLDAVERGEVTASDVVADDVEHGDDEPMEALTAMFLAGERLQRNPSNPDGLAELIGALEIARPERAPFGVERMIWERACALAVEVNDELTGRDVPDPEAAQDAAAELYDLLRPYV